MWPTQRAYTATTKLGFNGKLHRAQAHTRESTPASGSAVCTLDRAIFPPGRRAHDTKETFLARIVLRSCDRRAEFCLCGRLLTRCLALCVLCVVFRGYWRKRKYTRYQANSHQMPTVRLQSLRLLCSVWPTDAIHSFEEHLLQMFPHVSE